MIFDEAHLIAARGGRSAGAMSDAAVVLATRGVPEDWVWRVTRFGPTLRSRLRLLADGEEVAALAEENLRSVKPGDGFKMLKATPDLEGYRGKVPVMVGWDIRSSVLTKKEISRRLRVPPSKIQRWAKVQL